jgi:uncharacterized protein with GYD domain
MPTFVLSLNWTEQGIKNIKGFPKRSQAATELAEKVGVDIKQRYVTTGDSDLMLIVEAPDGDNVARFALALASQGNVRTRIARAWPQEQFDKLISQLP